LFILGAGSVGYDVKLRLKFALVRWYQRKQALKRHTDGKNGS
jgi:membrane protein